MILECSPYGPVFGPGDTIGLAVDAIKGTVVFFLNGMSIGTAFNCDTLSSAFSANRLLNLEVAVQLRELSGRVGSAGSKVVLPNLARGPSSWLVDFRSSSLPYGVSAQTSSSAGCDAPQLNPFVLFESWDSASSAKPQEPELTTPPNNSGPITSIPSQATDSSLANVYSNSSATDLNEVLY